jgi:hypothetical protein
MKKQSGGPDRARRFFHAAIDLVMPHAGHFAPDQ